MMKTTPKLTQRERNSQQRLEQVNENLKTEEAKDKKEVDYMELKVNYVEEKPEPTSKAELGTLQHSNLSESQKKLDLTEDVSE